MLKTVGAYAVRRSDLEQPPLLATDQETLNKIIALRWIGEWEPPDDEIAAPVREALLQGRWADAVLSWMEATEEVLDIFPFGIDIHEPSDYPDDEFGVHIQTTPLFRDR